MSKLFRYGGVAASIVLIAFGIGAVVIGVNGRDQVRSDLAREQIVGTPDSTIPGQKVDTGSEAQAFANVMRKHTLEATGGQTYAQMGQFLDKAGKPTSDEKAAAIDPKTQKPVSNPARQIWVTETALTTALNTAYFAENVALFAIVVLRPPPRRRGIPRAHADRAAPHGPRARGGVAGLRRSGHGRLTSLPSRLSAGPAPDPPGRARRRAPLRVRSPPQPDRGPPPMAPGRSPRTVGPCSPTRSSIPRRPRPRTASTPRSATSCALA